jgi:protein-S-isoprenylcysteine O-methyltransferase Ste14
VNPMRPARASTLVTSGVFAWSRNPIYLGDLLLLAACAVVRANRWVCAVADVRALPQSLPDRAGGCAHAIVWR